MKRQMLLGSVLAAAMAVGLAAQGQYPSQSSATQNSAQKSNSNTVTLTGCLEPSSQSSSATGTTGTTPSSSSSTAQFMLTNVSSGASSSASSATSASSTGTTGTESNVMLEGKNLQKHEGHKVEVKGHWADNSGSMSGSSTSGTTGSSATGSSASGSSSMSASNGKTLRVSSIKDVSSSCSGS